MKRTKPKGFGKDSPSPEECQQMRFWLEKNINLIRRDYPQFRDLSQKELTALCLYLLRALSTKSFRPMTEIDVIYDLRKRRWFLRVNGGTATGTRELKEAIAQHPEGSQFLYANFPRSSFADWPVSFAE